MQQSCPLSVKGSFVAFVLPADHMHLMHMVFICIPFCPQCEVYSQVRKGSVADGSHLFLVASEYSPLHGKNLLKSGLRHSWTAMIFIYLN
jgi:hypothetical protein